MENPGTIVMYVYNHIDNNRISSFLINIDHIHFPYLTMLILHKTEIPSIESMHRLSLPMLKFLNLSN